MQLVDLRDKVGDSFKRLNFSNSCWVMISTPLFLFGLMHCSYIGVEWWYRKRVAERIPFEGKAMVIRPLFSVLNNLATGLLKAIMFVLPCAVVLNLKTQYLQ